MPKTTIDNAQLNSYLLHIAQGDRDSFEALYKATKDTVFLFALSIVKDYHLAEDVMQESFLRVAGNIGKYQANSNPKAWILSITRNLCLDNLRLASRHDVELDENISDNIQDPSNLLSEHAQETIAALQILNQQEREVVSLYVFAELRQTEIAETLHLSYVRVRSIYKYALKKLRTYYKSERRFL